MALTRQQLQQNIEAMERQGASQQEIQGYLDSQRSPAASAAPQPSRLENARSFVSEATPGYMKPVVNAGAGILGAMTSSMRKFGTTLGTAAATLTNADEDINAAAVGEQDSRQKLAALLKRDDISEVQKSHIRSQLGDGPDVGTTSEQVDLKSTRQVVGEGVGTAAEVASILAMGRLKGGKELSTVVAESLPRSFATQFPNVARYVGYAGTGAVFGGTNAAGRSLQDVTRPPKDVVRDTAWGMGIGALTNVAIPAVLEGSALIYRKAYEALSGVPKEAIDKLVDDPSGMLGRLSKAGADPAQAQADILQTFDDGVNAVREARSSTYEASLEAIKDRTLVSTFDPNELLGGGQLGESEKKFLSERMLQLADKADEAAAKMAERFDAQKVSPIDYDGVLAPYREQAAKYREAADLALTDPSKAAALDPDATAWWKGDDGRWTETNLSPSKVKGNFTKLLNDFQFRRTNGLWSVGKADIPSGYVGMVNELAARIDTWDDFTPLGINQLRRVISSYDDGASPAFSKIIGTLAEQTDRYVQKNAPDAIRAMNADYAKDSRLLDSLKKEIGGPDSNKQMMANRIIGLFKPNSVYRKSLIDELGPERADELMTQVSAYLMSQLGPQGGLRKLVELGGASVLGLTQGMAAWQFAPAALLASPRIGATITAPAAAIGKGILDIARRVGPAVAGQAGGDRVK